MKRFRLIFLFMILEVVALGDDRFWRNDHGNLAPNTEARSTSLDSPAGFLSLQTRIGDLNGKHRLTQFLVSPKRRQ
jgi:hypothetical protein